MTELFPTIGNADWSASLQTAQVLPNSVSQQVRIKAGWPLDFNFSVLAAHRDLQADYLLVFVADICTHAGCRSDRTPIASRVIGKSYDCVAAMLRCAGFTVELWTPTSGSEPGEKRLNNVARQHVRD